MASKKTLSNWFDDWITVEANVPFSFDGSKLELEIDIIGWCEYNIGRRDKDWMMVSNYMDSYHGGSMVIPLSKNIHHIVFKISFKNFDDAMLFIMKFGGKVIEK